MSYAVPYTNIVMTDDDLVSIRNGRHPLCKEYPINEYHRNCISNPTMRKSDVIRMDVPKFRVVTEHGEGDCVCVEIPTTRYGVKLDSGKFAHFIDGIAYFTKREITPI